MRNVIIRRSYLPIGGRAGKPEQDFMTRFHAGELTADQVLSYYAAQVYRITGSRDAAARRLRLDRRTVKPKVAARAAL